MLLSTHNLHTSHETTKKPTYFTKAITLTEPILRKIFYSCAFKSMDQCCEPLARAVVPKVTVTRQKQSV